MTLEPWESWSYSGVKVFSLADLNRIVIKAAKVASLLMYLINKYELRIILGCCYQKKSSTICNYPFSSTECCSISTKILLISLVNKILATLYCQKYMSSWSSYPYELDIVIWLFVFIQPQEH